MGTNPLRDLYKSHMCCKPKPYSVDFAIYYFFYCAFEQRLLIGRNTPVTCFVASDFRFPSEEGGSGRSIWVQWLAIVLSPGDSTAQAVC